MEKLSGIVLLILVSYGAVSLAAGTKDPCVEGLACESSPGIFGICIGGMCITEIPMEERRNLTFTITVKYPEDKISGSDLFIRGNGFGLNWKSGERLTKISTNTWEKVIIYKTTIHGFLCESCSDETVLLSSDKFEYRILVDDSQDMIGANFAVELPVSKAALPDSPKFEVYPWFTETSGTALEVSVDSVYLGTLRSIGVYLPPSFYENPYKKYGALLVYDLSPKFVQFLKRDVFDKFMAVSGIMEETVIIGWGDFNQTERTQVLTQVPGTSFDCINGTLMDRCNDCYPEGLDSVTWLETMRDRCGYPYTEGGQGEAGLDFFIKEVLPAVAEQTNGRLLTNRENIGIMGYSLGGLMACHAAWTRHEAIGYAACQSSSFYWPMDAEANMGFHFHNVSLRDPQLLENRKPQKIYVDVGGVEGGPPYYQDTGAIEAVDLMSRTDFFNLDENLWFEIFPSHPHSSLNWIIRVWNPVSVLIPPKGTPTRISMLEK